MHVFFYFGADSSAMIITWGFLKTRHTNLFTTNQHMVHFNRIMNCSKSKTQKKEEAASIATQSELGLGDSDLSPSS